MIILRLLVSSQSSKIPIATMDLHMIARVVLMTLRNWHVKLGINGGVTILESTPSTAQQTFSTSIFDLNETRVLILRLFLPITMVKALLMLNLMQLIILMKSHLHRDLFRIRRWSIKT